VGDIAFQRKCLSKMEDVRQHGRTVLFVSHNMTGREHGAGHRGHASADRTCSHRGEGDRGGGRYPLSAKEYRALLQGLES